MNTDRMSRAVRRAQEHAQTQERLRWLRSLTPEHRAIHERQTQSPCGICLQKSLAAGQESLRLAMEQFAAWQLRLRSAVSTPPPPSSPD